MPATPALLGLAQVSIETDLDVVIGEEAVLEVERTDGSVEHDWFVADEQPGYVEPDQRERPTRDEGKDGLGRLSCQLDEFVLMRSDCQFTQLSLGDCSLRHRLVVPLGLEFELAARAWGAFRLKRRELGESRDLLAVEVIGRPVRAQ
ncbi:MAG: hypothetical protein JWR85_265 [Marmoricola sp.]|nr:hypothetical protein [Marmoricola sp.]